MTYRRLSTVTLLSLSVLGVALWIAPAQNTRREDYLTPELRAAVTRLKQEAQSAPTTPATLVARGKLVFDWLNAYSLTGGPIPVNATQQLAPVYAIEAGEKDAAPPAQAAALPKTIDALIYELTLKDERPDALPVVTLNAAGPFQANSYQTIEQTLTTGSLPFQKGAVILAGKQFMSDGSAFQNKDPMADGYVTIQSAKAKFEAIEIPLLGMHGGFRGATPVPAFRLVDGALQPGDKVTLTYGDRSGGSKGIKIQSFANDRVMLPVYVDPEARQFLLTPSLPAYVVEGNPATQLRVIAPSVLKTGETFAVSIRGEDRLWNRASGTLPALNLLLNGVPLRDIPAGAPWQTISQLTITRPGTHRIQARAPGGQLMAESNPIWVEDAPQSRIYWGETHAHSGMSEGQGSIDAFYRYGRDDASLDFLGLSEHDIWLDDFEWKQMQDAVTRYTQPGKFIAFLAYEWTTTRQNGGHHNVFFRSPDKRRVPVSKAWNLPRLYQGLRSLYNTNDVLLIPHAHQAGEWRLNDPSMERLVEIMSCHGTFEWFGNYYLKRGFDVGFVAASDDHRTRPGLSGVSMSTLSSFGGLVAVAAPEKTAPAIFDALRDRATYAVTSADRILVDAALNGVKPGRRAPFSQQRKLTARVSGTAPLDRIDVIKNGELLFSNRLAVGSLAEKVLAQLSFESDSEPYIRDNPRGYRTWRGTIEVTGAKLAQFTEAHLDNRHSEFVRRDPANPNRLQFSTATRGRADIVELHLENVTASTKILIRTEAAREAGVSPPSVRPDAVTPALSLDLSFADLKDGLLVTPLPLAPHTDAVTLQLIDPNGPKDTTIDFADTTPAQAGDYYYIRVSQRNGARAWSSPMWLGGESVR